MELKPGYKLTDAGVIPDDWKESTVGQEFDVRLGKMVDALKNHGVLKPYLGNVAVKWGTIDLSEVQTMPMAKSDLERFRLRRGDLLVCEGRGVGRSAIWEDQLPECYYQKALHRLRARQGFDSHLMVELFRYWVDQGLLSNYVTESTIPHLTKEKLILIPLAVPPLAEQRAIAGALSDVDALIGALDQLIAKKRDLKQAAMQQLLTGHQRLPGFAPATPRFQQTEAGLIPDDWEVRTLGSMTTLLTNGFVGKATDFYVDSDDGVLYIQGYNVEENAFNLHGIKRISHDFHRRHQKSCLQPGDLLTIQTGDIGVTAVVPEEFAGANCHALVISRLMPQIAAPGFYCYLFNSERGRADFKEIETGSTMKHLNIGDMALLYLPSPTLSEQTAIAEVLSDMDAELAALEQKRDKTRLLKQGMMQELLTGKTRLVRPV